MGGIMKYEKIPCPVCGREVSAHIPAGGDGSALRLKPHKDRRGQYHEWCEHGFGLVERRSIIRAALVESEEKR